MNPTPLNTLETRTKLILLEEHVQQGLETLITADSLAYEE